MAVAIPFPLPSHGYALNSKMRINLDYIVAKFNEFNTGTASWDTVAVGTANNLTGTVTFYNASSAYYLTLQAGTTAASATYTLPTAVPTVNRQMLQSTTGGVMSWSALSFPSSYVGNELLYIDGFGTFTELAPGGGTKLLANSSPPSYATINGTTNRISATWSVGPILTFDAPQDLHTSANFQVSTIKTAAGSTSACGVQVSAANTGLTGSSTDLTFVAGGVAAGGIDNAGLFTSTSVQAATIRTTGIAKFKGGGFDVTVQGSGSQAADYTLTLPTAQGGSDSFLKNDGGGVLSWVTASSISGSVNAGTQYQLGYYASSSNAISGLTLITANRALASNANGLPVASATTATELGYVNGVTSAIQTQIDGKSPTAGNASLVTVGTVTSGTWSATTIAVNKGGTGQTSYTDGQLLIGNTTGNTLAKATLTGTSNQVVVTNGSGTITLSLPQSIATSSAVQFGTVGVGTAANANCDLHVNGTKKVLYIGAFGSECGIANAATPDLVGSACGFSANATSTAMGSWSGYLTFLAGNNGVSLTEQGRIASTGCYFRGTTTNNSAAAGFIGEEIVSTVAGATAAAATGTFDDLTSITLTAGDWDIMAAYTFDSNGATTTGAVIGIGTASGTGTTGLTQGQTRFDSGWASSATTPTAICMIVSPFRASLSGSTTYYLKRRFSYSAGTPASQGGILRARRVR